MLKVAGSEVSCTEINEQSVPVGYKLHQNYPNPFNPVTTISFSLNKADYVTIDIYNIKGEKIKSLLNEHLGATQHNIVWNGKNDAGEPVSSGIYFYKIKAGKFNAVKKMVLIK